MSRRNPAGAVLLLSLLGLTGSKALSAPPAAGPPPLPAEKQIEVKRAIEQGIKFLRRSQNVSGTWIDMSKPYSVGYAALPALTLLECGLKPGEREIRRAALLVRR